MRLRAERPSDRVSPHICPPGYRSIGARSGIQWPACGRFLSGAAVRVRPGRQRVAVGRRSPSTAHMKSHLSHEVQTQATSQFWPCWLVLSCCNADKASHLLTPTVSPAHGIPKPRSRKPETQAARPGRVRRVSNHGDLGCERATSHEHLASRAIVARSVHYCMATSRGASHRRMPPPVACGMPHAGRPVEGCYAPFAYRPCVPLQFRCGSLMDAGEECPHIVPTWLRDPDGHLELGARPTLETREIRPPRWRIPLRIAMAAMCPI